MFAGCCAVVCLWCLAVRCVGGELCMWSCERSSGAVCPRELYVCGARVYIFYYISRARARGRERREMRCLSRVSAVSRSVMT